MLPQNPKIEGTFQQPLRLQVGPFQGLRSSGLELPRKDATEVGILQEMDLMDHGLRPIR
jgi:hypothetical protein